jgi:hypothetical protein
MRSPAPTDEATDRGARGDWGATRLLGRAIRPIILLGLLACGGARRADCERFATVVNAASPGIAAASAAVSARKSEPEEAVARLTVLADRFGELAAAVSALDIQDRALDQHVGRYRLLATRLQDVAGAAAFAAQRGDAPGALKLIRDVAALAVEQDRLVQVINTYCGAR